MAQWITESAVLALLGGALGRGRRRVGREASGQAEPGGLARRREDRA